VVFGRSGTGIVRIDRRTSGSPAVGTRESGDSMSEAQRSPKLSVFTTGRRRDATVPNVRYCCYR
jgi:hypothetical protein